MRVLQEPNVQNCTNEANLKKNNMTYKALRYCLETLNKRSAPPTFSHGKGEWGKSLRTTINEGIAITNFQKIDTYIAKQCSHVEIPHFGFCVAMHNHFHIPIHFIHMFVIIFKKNV